jgi:hypothetical protein
VFFPSAFSLTRKILCCETTFFTATRFFTTDITMGFPASDAIENWVVGIDAIAPPPHDNNGGSQRSQGSQGSQGLVLPPLQCEAFISQRHEVNPALALNLLQDIQETVGIWQAQQRQIVQALQGLYAQGPMVDGWLQSSLSAFEPQPADASATILRHGDADALMQYVESLENSTQASSTQAPSTQAPSTQAHQYQLCSLKEDGSVRSQCCPPEQMALVGTAITRYQKFKQLMGQKQAIEAKLQQAVDLLGGVRTQLQLD